MRPYPVTNNGFDQPNLAAPSKNFSSHVAAWDSATYQLSVRLDKKLGVEDIVLIHRDYYQGTRFDKSKSSLVGLYGSQYHYIAEMGKHSILSVKTTHTHISQISEALSSPVHWMSTTRPLIIHSFPLQWQKCLKNTMPCSIPTIRR